MDVKSTQFLAKARPAIFLVFIALTGGCSIFYPRPTYQVLAPEDGFVCFNSTIQQCLMTYAKNRPTRYPSTTNATSGTDEYRLHDPDAGRVAVTDDKKYKCNYSSIPYEQRLNPLTRQKVVFVPPILISQISEQYLRLQRARESCQRVLAAYNSELALIPLQNTLAKYQMAVLELSARIENEVSDRGSYGGSPLTAGEISRFGVSDSQDNEADGLEDSRLNVASKSDILRLKYQQQLLTNDFDKQFYDAQSLIYSSSSELGQQLAVLDLIAPTLNGVEVKASNFMEGSWVHQGSVVLVVRRLDSEAEEHAK